jgi:DNA-binding transcriptional MerR regulator
MIVLPRIFTARQVMRITGIPYSRLNFWAKSGLIRPSVSDAAGSGSRRLYSELDLIAVRVAWNLRRSGISGRSLRKVMDHLRQHGLEDIKKAERVGNDVIATDANKRSTSVLDKPGQMFFDYSQDLSEAVSHIASELERARDSDGGLPRKGAQKAAAPAPQRRLQKA